MGIYTVVVIAALAMYLSRLCEEVFVQSDLVHEDLLAESFNIVDEVEMIGFETLAARRQRLIEGVVVAQIELDAELRRPVLDANLGRHDDFRVIECLDELLGNVISLRLQLHVAAEVTRQFAGSVTGEPFGLGSSDQRLIISSQSLLLELVRALNDLAIVLIQRLILNASLSIHLLNLADFCHADG